MESTDKLLADNQTILLRERIKAKYRQYQQQNPDRFPNLPYNTNRANYEPLRSSFEDEFYRVRKLERNDPNVHIPSTNTLALLFTDDSYTPSKKILNTCRSYAEGPTKPVAVSSGTAPVLTEAPAKNRINRLLIKGGLLGMFGIGLSTAVAWWSFRPAPSGLIITLPTQLSCVQQAVVVEGKVKNAETVWMIVRPVLGSLYYVQPPSNVSNNENWMGVIYVGGVNNESFGCTYQIRAVVNPTQTLRSGMVLHSWPDAQLLSKITEVVRDSILP